MLPVSAIKLIRTDTTLDLSQKAEKGMRTIWTSKGSRPSGQRLLLTIGGKSTFFIPLSLLDAGMHGMC